jgi:hypothetical protein
MVEHGLESSDALLRHLEQASGRKLRTRADIRLFLDEIAAGKLTGAPSAGHWRTAKQGMWLFMLVMAFLQYYLLDILIEINSISTITVNTRVPVQLAKPATRT